MGQFNGPAGMDMANLPHDDVSQALTITSGVLSVLAVLLVAGRVYGRAVLLRIFWWDDFCMLVATLVAVTMTACAFRGASFGVGKHMWDFDGDRSRTKIFKLTYAFTALYVVTLGFSRASILLQITRLVPMSRMRLVIWCIFGFSVSFSIAVFFASVFVCWPITYAWAPPAARGDRCVNFPLLQMVMAVVSILVDVVVWLAPLRLIWMIRLPVRRQKVGLVIVFMIGGLVWIAAITRLAYGSRARNLLAYRHDSSYHTAIMFMWSNIEAHVAITCSTIPTLRPIIRRFFPNILGASSHSNSNVSAAIRNSRIQLRRSSAIMDNRRSPIIESEYESTEEIVPAKPAKTSISDGDGGGRSQSSTDSEFPSEQHTPPSPPPHSIPQDAPGVCRSTETGYNFKRRLEEA
ncbi:hypothetical protein BZA05DRAFT_441351 [Tricharina praecox]|uniref:uncharacterized protein n=1 Tax=Tricharina praecox TaxID=43433 RepID=UPI002220D161|nr:uncharacterized protein BZA05DRAFT_441351 [Tricharina praecox]KAI5858070.1 hypothetical protein BZA05DRAFT_441351 [Tricharina praecox]